jgi:hypothetical protein
MDQNPYPPTQRWHELTTAEKTTRLDVSQDLLGVLQHWRGDPRLNAWEEGFLTGLVQLIQTYQGKAKITPKQWDKLHQILDKMAEPETATEETDV